MAKRSILIDFYKVKLNEGVLFKDLLTQISQMKVEQKTCTVYRDPIRMETVVRLEDGNWIGHMVKIRMDIVPRKVSMNNAGLEDVDLNPDQGIGEETSFLYNEKLNLILFQRNYHGIRIEHFSQYLLAMYEKMTDDEALKIDFLSIVGTDALNKLRSNHIIRKLDVRIATPTNPNEIAKFKNNLLLSSWIENLNISGSETINVSLSVGRGRKGTLITNIIQSAAEIAIKEKDIVEKFRVRGRENETANLEWIDLLEDRTHEYIEINVARGNPLTHERMSKELIRIWDHKIVELQSYFTSGKR